jgi:hypothetical protein
MENNLPIPSDLGERRGIPRYLSADLAIHRV